MKRATFDKVRKGEVEKRKTKKQSKKNTLKLREEEEGIVETRACTSRSRGDTKTSGEDAV